MKLLPRLTIALLSISCSVLLPDAVRAEVSDACPGFFAGSGTASWYDYQGNGRCYFVGDDSEPMVAAMNSADFDGSEICGQWLRVTGPLGSVDVKIVDECPSCPAGWIDLNEDAAALIGDIGAGLFPITWETIEAPVAENLRIHVHTGSNPFYVELQARRHRYGIESIEYLGPSGYVDLPRRDYNVFVLEFASGLVGPYSDPMSLRVTDVHGQSLEITGVPLVAGATHDTGVQFPSCSTATAAPFPAAARLLTLHAPAPNPFNPRTELAFELARPTTVELAVFDAQGRAVRTLVDGAFDSGTHRVTWNGRDDAGRAVASGVYHARLRGAGTQDVRRLVLLQ